MDLDLLLADLEELVAAESPSEDPAAVRVCAERFARMCERLAGGSSRIGEDGRVRWEGGGSGAGDGPAPVLILGHLDTVWPVGTLGRMPFEIGSDAVRGPGVFDMKGGLVCALHALAELRDRSELPPVRLLATTDEELGSPRSREQIRDEAARCRRVLVPEPCGEHGAVKVARKGVALGRLVVHGRASHAGLEPERGVNASVILGGLLADVAALGGAAAGTTVTPTVLSGGTTVNTVPARAEARVDLRFREDAEVERVRTALSRLPVPADARLETAVEVNRPALPRASAAPLLPALRAAAAVLGQDVDLVAVGGGSDGNLAAAAGAAVLDGLGPEGGGAHAEDEHVTLAGIERRVRLLTELVPRVALVEVP